MCDVREGGLMTFSRNREASINVTGFVRRRRRRQLNIARRKNASVFGDMTTAGDEIGAKGIKENGGEDERRASCHRRDDSKVISPEVTSADERTFYRGANEVARVDFTALGFALQHRDDRKENRARKEKERERERKATPLPQINPLFTTEIYESHSAASCPLPPRHSPRPPSTYTPGLHSIFPSLAAYKGRNCDHLSLTPGCEDEFWALKPNRG